MRQGGDPRLPLELALVKVTRPGADLSRESLAFRLELLEQRPGQAVAPAPAAERATPAAPQPDAEPAPPAPTSEAAPEPAATGPPLELEQLQDAWQRTVAPGGASAVDSRPPRCSERPGRPRSTADTLTIEFPATADFHRRQTEEPKNVGVVREALYEVTGHKLGVVLALGEPPEGDVTDDDDPLDEEALISMFKDTFDAEEVEEPR